MIKSFLLQRFSHELHTSALSKEVIHRLHRLTQIFKTFICVICVICGLFFRLYLYSIQLRNAVSISLILLLLSFFSNDLMSEEKNFQYTRYMRSSDTPVSLGYLAFVLTIMGSTIIFIVWVLKKISFHRFQNHKTMILRESLYLGNKTYLHIVEIAGKSIVIGVGPYKVQVITKMQKTEEASSPCEKASITTSFEKILTEAIVVDQNAIPSEAKSTSQNSEKAM